MASGNSELMGLVRAIVAGSPLALRILAASPGLARTSFTAGATREDPKTYLVEELRHYIYVGDTALHFAAAAYQTALARKLLALGADVRARNRRGAEPLHYAVDGGPRSAFWNPGAQGATVTCLLEAGADPNALDKSGVTPLHRAVRTRCTAAVKALLEGGADLTRRNKNGSTPLQVAGRTTGRGGSGSPESKAEQAEIIRLLTTHGA